MDFLFLFVSSLMANIYVLQRCFMDFSLFFATDLLDIDPAVNFSTVLLLLHRDQFFGVNVGG